MSPSWLLACCFELSTPTANLDRGLEPPDSTADGVYGRFESDLDLGIAAGASWLGGASAVELRGTLHYFWTAGVYVGAGLPIKGEDDGPPGLSFGVDLRPAYLPRFSENLEQGPAVLDLWLDSISLSLGPHFALDGGGRSLELSLGSGLPLFATSWGPWLEARAVARVPDGDDRTQFGGLLLLGWHEGFSSPLVRDETPRFAAQRR